MICQEIQRTCLFRDCPACGGKQFRFLLTGTFESDDFGTTAGIKIRDRCEDCKLVLAETQPSLDSEALRIFLAKCFGEWEQRLIDDDEFVRDIQLVFESAGGWLLPPAPFQKTG